MKKMMFLFVSLFVMNLAVFADDDKPIQVSQMPKEVPTQSRGGNNGETFRQIISNYLQLSTFSKSRKSLLFIALCPLFQALPIICFVTPEGLYFVRYVVDY